MRDAQTTQDVSWSDGSTLLSEGGGDEVLLLTLLYHPDLTRVGEHAVVRPDRRGRARVSISRVEPGFARIGCQGVPLDLPTLSRSPLLVVADGRCLSFLPERGNLPWRLGGALVAPGTCVALDQARRGVVVELGGAVLVGVRWARPPGEGLDLIGGSPELEGVREQIRLLGPRGGTVLLRGETGTGKERVARALHQQSGARGAFVSVNMGAIPESVAASELFGHEAGAYTGAQGARGGYFEQARGGTLLLDELGELSPALQPMLLRALDPGEIQPVGGRPRPVATRLIFSTDADLHRLVDEGRMRPALYYRVATAEIVVPPLRERPEDVAEQAVHFLREALERSGRGELLDRRDRPWFPLQAMRTLLGRSWPGNTRELRSWMERVALSPHGHEPWAQDPAPQGTASPPPVGAGLPTDRAELEEALRVRGYRPQDTADALGVALNTLYARMGALGVPRARDLTREQIARAREEAGDDVPALAAHLRVSERGLRLRLRALQDQAERG
ncbi:MAG: sigma-54-dependent Fis family transcriptional regulator [Deltaproteobacteria bacterium]|nr:sigma-54-dependent Fis family transcriptional regulator [Deltaproteobacteria bacterium]